MRNTHNISTTFLLRLPLILVFQRWFLDASKRPEKETEVQMWNGVGIGLVIEAMSANARRTEAKNANDEDHAPEVVNRTERAEGRVFFGVLRGVREGLGG